MKRVLIPGFHGLNALTNQKKCRWAWVCPKCAWTVKPQSVGKAFLQARARGFGFMGWQCRVIYVVLGSTAVPKKSRHWSPVTRVAVAMAETFGAPPMSLSTI